MGAARAREVSPQHLTFTAAECVEVARMMPDAAIVPVHYEDWMHFSEGRAEIETTFASAGLGHRLNGVGSEGRDFGDVQEPARHHQTGH